jgi:hypothetical protein
MATVDFKYPICLYQVHLSLEDWLANFAIDVEKIAVEPPPPATHFETTIVAVAIFQPTTIEGLVFTRENLVALFTEKEVVEQELEASYAYLESLPE